MNCRILYVVGQLGPGGGLERQLWFLLKNMDRSRIQPQVVVWSFCEGHTYVPKIRSLGVQLHFFSNNLSAAAKLKAFRRLVWELKPEVVHSYSFYTNFAAWWATLNTKRIGVGSIRNNFVTDIHGAGRILGRLSARWPVAQICNSSAAVKMVEQSKGLFKPADLYVVRNRLDINEFKPSPVFPITPLVLAVGRLSPEKCWHRLLRVVAMAKGRGLHFSVRLAGEGPQLEELETHARNLGVDKTIEFLGFGEGIAALLAEAMFLIHTADAEGCPNVVMEAMACGRAVVATDAGDVPFLVEDGKTGFVVRRGDDATLADRMVTLLTDRELCRRMGEAGRTKAEREFGLTHLVSETLAAYRSAGWKGF